MVALEVTGNAWEVARIIEPQVAREIVVSPSDTGIRQAIRQARAKTSPRCEGATRAKRQRWVDGMAYDEDLANRPSVS